MLLHDEDGYTSKRRISITDLPREMIRLIALRIYDPLELTQQDRTTWGIFSTVDMHQERQDDLASLISLGTVCRKIRREVRRVLFTCVRVSGVSWAEEVIENRDGWAKYVKSIIIDLTMFDSDFDASTRPRLSFSEYHPPVSTMSSTTEMMKKPRTCWAESSLLTALLNSLPNLNHMSFFADASDDSTLALLFASLITHPSSHSVPPTVISTSPAISTISGSGSGRYPLTPFIPLPHRLKSFGWRQRAAPPSNFRQFSQSSTFVSTLHLLRHAHNLSFLVLDADMDEMTLSDVLSPLRELALRQPPMGEKAENVSLMLCGPIKGWENGFLRSLVNTFEGIKELFVDRPLRKSTEVKETSFEDFTDLLGPLSSLPHLRLLQVGSYTFTTSLQASIVRHLSRSIQSLLVVGLLGEEGETTWWGIWRRASSRGMMFAASTEEGEGEYDESSDIRIKFLNDGELKLLEEEIQEWKKSQPPTPPTSAPIIQDRALKNVNDDADVYDDIDVDNDSDIRMSTPRHTQSPIAGPKEVERNQALGLSLEGDAGSSEERPSKMSLKRLLSY
ncbi:uncharacterized protein IL334_002204 [Kwoniella shivajii]|uniref:F-box domain-containing protein n=1 Tax=Kwoniella shivajii TaxID=564305 RepID=A0ABZ1CU21_9TREE|nr:hypothetical protein IL334_002204 [Kwoniella shivajii]